MGSKSANLGPAQQSSAGLLHFERWQGNWIHREPQATENPVTRFPTGGSMLSDYADKIATASTSPEIFLAFGITGFFSGFRSCHTVTGIFPGPADVRGWSIWDKYCMSEK